MTPEELNDVIAQAAVESIRDSVGELSLSPEEQFEIVLRCVLLHQMWQFERVFGDRMAAWIATVRSNVDPMWTAAADQLLAEYAEMRREAP